MMAAAVYIPNNGSPRKSYNAKLQTITNMINCMSDKSDDYVRANGSSQDGFRKPFESNVTVLNKRNSTLHAMEINDNSAHVSLIVTGNHERQAGMGNGDPASASSVDHRTSGSSEFFDTYEPPHQNGPDYLIPTDKYHAWKADDPVKLCIKSSGIASIKPVSIVTTIERIVKTHSNRTALSVKRNNLWCTWTYAKYLDDIRTVAKAFTKLGLERFHGVGILGFNAPEWLISGMAAIFAGGLQAGIYATNSPDACHYILNNCKANIVVVENEAQLKKIMEIKDRLPHLKAIVQYIGEPTEPGVMSWADLLNLGSSVPDEILERRVKSLAINQCCLVVYTSGTTGNPKGVMINQDNLINTATFIQQYWNITNDDFHSSLVSFLPLSHIAALIADAYVSMLIGGELIFACPDAFKGSLGETLKEREPRYFLGVPRVYDKMCEKVLEVESKMKGVLQTTVRWARRLGLAYSKSKLNGNSSAPYGYVFGKLLIRRIQSSLGFTNADSCFCGAAPVCNETVNFFLSVNVLILNCYGMSECTGPHIMNTKANYRLGSVGKSTPYETKIYKPDEHGNGEICLRGRHVFMGYLDMEEKTLEALDDDNWLHSGDIGQVDQDGYLFITGRIKDLLITAGGENVPPTPIEDAVKSELPVVNHAVLIGDERKFLSMLLTLKTDVDPDTLLPKNTLTHIAREWCRSIGSDAQTVEEVLEGPDRNKIMAEIELGIQRVNTRATSNAQRIQKWTALPQDFSITGGELGPTLKLKRDVVMKKYHEAIEDFYSNC